MRNATSPAETLRRPPGAPVPPAGAGELWALSHSAGGGGIAPSMAPVLMEGGPAGLGTQSPSQIIPGSG